MIALYLNSITIELSVTPRRPDVYLEGFGYALHWSRAGFVFDRLSTNA